MPRESLDALETQPDRRRVNGVVLRCGYWPQPERAQGVNTATIDSLRRLSLIVDRLA